MSQLKWYVVRAIASKEKKAKTYLENEITRRKFEEYVPQVLIPTEKVYEMRNGKNDCVKKAFSLDMSWFMPILKVIMGVK